MHIAALALLCLCNAAALAQTPSGEEARNLEVLKRYADFGRHGDYAQQAALWAPDAVNNGRPTTPDEIRTTLEDMRRTFPDLTSTTLEMRAVGDMVIVLQRTSGTHRGTAQTGFYGGMLLAARPTGRRFEVLRSHWWRLRDGKIVWHQVVSDDLGMMRQLGLIPAALPADKLVTPSKD